MSVLITGASGNYGSIVIEALLRRGVDPSDITATGRHPDALAPFRNRDVHVARLDYADPNSIAPALTGVDTVLLVSASDPVGRVPLHQNVIDAAVAAGVRRIVYTSVTEADRNSLLLASDHRDTEALLAAAPITATVLRNNWYSENYVPAMQQAAATGELIASVGDARVASATRADYAEAAAAVLMASEHDGNILELGAPTAWDYQELAAAMSTVIGHTITYRPVSANEHTQLLRTAGLDEATTAFIVGLDGGIGGGALAYAAPTLADLLQREPTSLTAALQAAHTVDAS